MCYQDFGVHSETGLDALFWDVLEVKRQVSSEPDESTASEAIHNSSEDEKQLRSSVATRRDLPNASSVSCTNEVDKINAQETQHVASFPSSFSRASSPTHSLVAVSLGSRTTPGSVDDVSQETPKSLPNHYVPVGSNNQKHLKGNVNLQYFRRSVHKRQQQPGKRKRKVSNEEELSLRHALHEQLKVVHEDPELPPLVFVVEVPDGDQSAEEFGGRYYRRAPQELFSSFFTGQHNFRVFLPPLDSSVIQDMRDRSSALVEEHPDRSVSAEQFQGMVEKLYQLLLECSLFHDILEDNFIKSINDAWDRINDRCPRNSRKRRARRKDEAPGGKGSDDAPDDDDNPSGGHGCTPTKRYKLHHNAGHGGSGQNNDV